MVLRCSRCHTVFSPEEGAEPACPQCHAEAGLEPVKGIPAAMRAFGLLLGAILVAVVAGDLVSRLAG